MPTIDPNVVFGWESVEALDIVEAWQLMWMRLVETDAAHLSHSDLSRRDELVRLSEYIRDHDVVWEEVHLLRSKLAKVRREQEQLEEACREVLAAPNDEARRARLQVLIDMAGLADELAAT